MAKREIKFRGKRVHNGEWVYGYYVRHETRQICPIGDDKLKLEEIKHLIVVDSFADWNMPRQLQGIEVIPETVGQYTGLKDREGVEIYEGDIAIHKDYECFGKVVFSDDELAFAFLVVIGTNNKGPTTEFEWLYEYADGLEVIGNIHDKEAQP